jgi:hypothetical protein
MEQDKVNEKTGKLVVKEQDITWDKLVRDSEYEISFCKEKISKLRKSIGFFKKQAALGIQFPRLHDKT